MPHRLAPRVSCPVALPGLLLALCVGALSACDRNVGPYVPGEEPKEPDLSQIFPEGAERAARNAGPPGIPDALTAHRNPDGVEVGGNSVDEDCDGFYDSPPGPIWQSMLDAPDPQGGRGLDASAQAPPIRGVVEVSPELSGRVPSGGVLFLIARSGGGGPPLAVVRVPEPSFPLSFEIGPENRMIPTIPFAGELKLSARLDQDGDAASRAPGDLQGVAEGAHAPGTTGVTITLSEVL